MKKNLIKTVKITHKVLYIKLSILVMVLLPIAVFTLLASKTNAIPGIKSFVVLSGSMEPTLPVASLIYTKKEASYGKGDVIAFKNKADQTVTHRIIEVVQEGTALQYKTQGDANNASDEELVSADNVLGKNVFSVPYVGRVINFMRSPLGFFYAIVFPGLVFVFLELWNIKKEIERVTEKKIMERMRKAESNSVMLNSIQHL